MVDALKIFSGNANPGLATEICEYLRIPCGEIYVGRFSDGETSVKINENIRGADVFVFQPTVSPASNVMELLIMLDAVSRASSRRTTAVVPYFGYARQDRKDQPRVSITAKLMANLITVAGADRVLTMDLHSPQIQGFFDIPFDHLYSAPVLIDWLRRKNLRDLVVVAPDIGSVKMARAYSTRLDASLALVEKRRPRADEVEVMSVIGDIEGKNAVIIDDMVTTGRTLIGAAVAVREAGAKEIYAGATHALFIEGIQKRLDESPIRELVVTNTVPQDPASLSGKVRVLSVGKLLGEAIRRIHEEESLSSLFV